MAIIKCKQCGQSISDKATICSHCGFDFSASSEEQLAQSVRADRLKMQYRLDLILYASMLVFVVGVLAHFFGRQNQSLIYQTVGYLGLVGGGLGYLWSRIQKFIIKRDKH